MIAGHYRLVDHIGSGAMGVVWRAVDERLERSVAVKKVIGRQGLSEADRIDLHRRAMREAKIAARLQHPNAIVVYDIAEHEGNPCLIMEYLPSRSLSAIINERGTLPVAEVARIGEQVASALVAAHRAGIVHRDVKPGNILIDDTGVAKLTDFGISRAHGDMTITQTGLVGGTPAYLAPELARGADPAATSDVFSLGATLYHAIEGRSPYGSNPNQLALLHTAASGKIIPPQAAGAATSLLNSLLRVAPEERASMSQAAERLAAIAAGGGVPAPPAPIVPTQPPNVPPPWQRTAVAPPPPTRQQGTAMFGAVDHSGGPPPQANPKQGQEQRRNGALLAGAAAFVLMLAAAVLLLLQPGDDETPSATPPQPGTTAPSEPSAPPTSEGHGNSASSGEIDWSEAGELVIDYYTLPDEIEDSWEMLTPSAQAQFGGQQGFQQYWSQFSSVYAEQARANSNDDGSVDITATVHRDGNAEQTTVRVIQVDGDLLIDSAAR
ncbi:MAG: serine/threonine-protein kinase [Haloechinothrix sp.]